MNRGTPPPLVRIVCSQHRGRTVGRIIGTRREPMYVAPTTTPFVSYWEGEGLRRRTAKHGMYQSLYEDPDILGPFGLDDVPTAMLVAHCPDCKKKWEVPIEVLREAAAGLDPVMVLSPAPDGSVVLTSA